MLVAKNDSNFNLRVVGAIHTQSSWDIFSMAMWVIATSIYHRNRWFHKANHVPPCSVFSPASTVGDFATVCCSGSWGHYRAQHVAQSPWTSGIGGNILFFWSRYLNIDIWSFKPQNIIFRNPWASGIGRNTLNGIVFWSRYLHIDIWSFKPQNIIFRNRCYDDGKRFFRLMDQALQSAALKAKSMFRLATEAKAWPP